DNSRETLEKLAQGHDFEPISLHATTPIEQVSGDTSELLSGPTANTPIPVIAESAWTASVNCPPSDVDGVRRAMPLVVSVQGKVYASLVLQILMRMEEVKSSEVKVVVGETITIPRSNGEGEFVIPIDETGSIYLNYRNTDRFFVVDYLTIAQQIQRSEAGEPWPEALPPLEGQVVLIGQSAEGLSDFGPTPYRAEEALFKVQATALDSILRGDYVKQYPPLLVLILWTLIGWATLIFLRKAPIAAAISVPIAIAIAYIIVAFTLFASASILLPIVLPIAGFVVIHTTMTGDRLAKESKEKKYIRGVFGSYVSPEIVNQIISSGETPELGGEEVDITILFSDIQGFSTFSEQLAPKDLVELMVEYLSVMTDIVTDSGGTLDKYIGDAIDAMFGAPIALPNHARDGIDAAILMQRMQTELREKWTREERTPLVREMRTRIGLNTGRAVVGNMGSKRRFNYTMMGDNVNLAARLESGAKQYGVYTLVSEDTRNEARADIDDVLYRFIDQIVVKGRTLP
ncbi:MAG: adenylate/guanylate cyclase domain-containing protein, partial [Verrucomicrobiota bacterium]